MLLLVTAGAGRVLAGNQDTFFLGNEAALAGGAVTATSRGPDSVWYNPAGVGASGRSAVDVSAGAYLLRFGGAPTLQQRAGSTGKSIELETIDLLAVPAALGYARRLGALYIGFGVFVPVADAAFPKAWVRTDSSPSSPATEVALDSASRRSEYFAGPAVAFKFNEKVRWGASLLALYRTDVSSTTIASRVGEQEGGAPSFSFEHDTTDSLVLGLGLVTGVQWQIDGRWRVGFVARSPVAHIFSRVLETHIVGENAMVAEDDSFGSRYRATTDFSMRPLAPPRFHLGLARRFPKAVLSFESSLQSGLSATHGTASSDAVINGRIGGVWAASSTLSAGAGLFSDRATQRSGRVDYYGTSVAVSFGPKGWALPPRERLAEGVTLESVTTIAISYALGPGRVRAAVVDSDDERGVSLRTVEHQIVAHQLMLHLGSSLLF